MGDAANTKPSQLETNEAAQDALKPDEWRAIAKEAYIYGFPMVMNYKTMWNYVGNKVRFRFGLVRFRFG